MLFFLKYKGLQSGMRWVIALFPIIVIKCYISTKILLWGRDVLIGEVCAGGGVAPPIFSNLQDH